MIVKDIRQFLLKGKFKKEINNIEAKINNIKANNEIFRRLTRKLRPPSGKMAEGRGANDKILFNCTERLGL